jgi:hypothetical protein
LDAAAARREGNESRTALAVPFERSARWPASPCLASPEIAVGDLDVTASADAAMEAVTSVILVSPAVPAQELGVPAPSRR